MHDSCPCDGEEDYCLLPKVSGFFFFEWQFPAMNKLILLFCFEWQFPAMNKLVSLLFHFYFYFHFRIKIICVVLKIILKRISISSSVKNKIILHFTFTLMINTESTRKLSNFKSQS